MRAVAAALAGLTLTMLAPTGLGAQTLLRRTPGTGQLGASLLSTTSGGSERTNSLDRTFRQWVRMAFQGSLVHPRFLSYDLAFRPTFAQRSSPGVDQSVDERQLGWDVGIRAFAAQPVSLTIASSRASGSAGSGLGGRADFANAHLSGIANFRVPALPMRIEYNNRTSQNTWQSGTGLAPVAWSNRTRTTRFVAQNSKLQARIERFDFDDRLGDSDFAMWNVSAQHRFRWGTGSRLQSAYNRSDRTGAMTYLRTSWTEALHLRHGAGASSDANYRAASTTTPLGNNENRALTYTLNTRPSRFATFSIAGSTSTSRFNGTREQVRAITPRASVRTNLPLDIRLMAAVSYGYERRTREQSAAQFVTVVNERHAVDATRSFFLDQTDVDTVSIVVRSADETLTYTSGVDYQIVDLGGSVEIVVPPTSRIAEGDRVLVSYRFSPQARPSGTLANSSYDVALSRHGVTLSHRRGRRDASENGDEALLGLGTFDVTHTSLMARLPTPVGRWDISLIARNRRSSALDFSSRELATSLAMPTLIGVQSSVGMSARRSSSSGRVVLARSAFLTGNFAVLRRGRVNTRLQVWDIHVDEAAADRSVSLDVNVSQRLAAFDLDGQFQLSRRVAPFDVNATRASVRVVRRF